MTAFTEQDISDLEALVTEDFPCDATLYDHAAQGAYDPVEGEYAAGAVPSKSIKVTVPYEWRRRDREDRGLDQQSRLACIARGQDLVDPWEPKRGMRLSILDKMVVLIEVVPIAAPTNPARIAFYELVWAA